MIIVLVTKKEKQGQIDKLNDQKIKLSTSGCQNDLFGDYLKEQQCHHDCCPGEYVEICCNTTPPQATPTTVGKVVNFLSPFPPHCPPGLHQVSCPW